MVSRTQIRTEPLLAQLPDLPDGLKWNVERDYSHRAGESLLKLHLADANDLPLETRHVDIGGIVSKYALVLRVANTAKVMWTETLQRSQQDKWIEEFFS